MSEKKTFGDFILEISNKLKIDFVPIQFDDSSYNVTGCEFDEKACVPIKCSFCGNKMDNISVAVINFYGDNPDQPMCSECGVKPSGVNNEELIKAAEKNMDVKLIRLNEYEKIVKTKKDEVDNFELSKNEKKLKTEESPKAEEQESIDETSSEEIEDIVQEEDDDNEIIEEDFSDEMVLSTNEDEKVVDTSAEVEETKNYDEAIDEKDSEVDTSDDGIENELVEDELLNQLEFDSSNGDEEQESINETSNEEIEDIVQEEDDESEELLVDQSTLEKNYDEEIIKDRYDVLNEEDIDLLQAAQEEDDNDESPTVIDTSDEVVEEETSVFEDVTEAFVVDDSLSDIDNYIEELKRRVNDKLASEAKNEREGFGEKLFSCYDPIIEKATDSDGNLLGIGIENVRFTCQECGSTFKLNTKSTYLEEDHFEKILSSLYCSVSIYDEYEGSLRNKYTILNCPECRLNIVPYSNNNTRTHSHSRRPGGFFNKLLHFTLELYIDIENERWHNEKNQFEYVSIDEDYMNMRSIHDLFNVNIKDLETGKVTTEKTNLVKYITHYEDVDLDDGFEEASKRLIKRNWKNMINPDIRKNNYAIINGYEISFYDKHHLLYDVSEKSESFEKGSTPFDKASAAAEKSVSIEPIPSDFRQVKKEDEEFDCTYNRVLRELKSVENPVIKHLISSSMEYQKHKIFRADKYTKSRTEKKNLANPFSNPSELLEEFEHSQFYKLLSLLGDIEMNIKIDNSTMDIPIVDIVGKANQGTPVRLVCYDLKELHLLSISPFFEKGIPFSFKEYSRKSKKPYKLFPIYSDSVEHGGMLGVAKCLRKILNGIDDDHIINLTDGDFPLFYTTDINTYMTFGIKNSPNGSLYTKVAKPQGSITILASTNSDDSRTGTEMYIESIRNSLFNTDRTRDRISILKESNLHPACGCKYYTLRNPVKRYISYFITDYIENGSVMIEDGLELCCSIILKEHYFNNNADKNLFPVIYVEYDKASIPSPTMEKLLHDKTPNGSRIFRPMGFNQKNNDGVFNMNFFLRNQYKQLGIDTFSHAVVKNPSEGMESMIPTDHYRYDARLFSSKRSIIQAFGQLLQSYNINTNEPNHVFIKNVMNNLSYIKLAIIPPMTFLAQQNFLNKIRKNMMVVNKLEWNDNDYTLDGNNQNSFIKIIETWNMIKMFQNKNVNITKKDRERLIKEMLMRKMFENSNPINSKILNNNIFNNIGGFNDN